MGFRRYWAWLIGVIVASFAVLGYYGWEIYQVAPPIPERVVTTDGRELYTRSDITNGQNVWQSMGGQEVGSVWGHGGYTAPDWTADWLHREAVWFLDTWATRDHGLPYAQLNAEQQAALRARLQQELRTNTYDPATGTLTISPLRAEAIAAVSAHYTSLFGNDPALAELRDAYAIPANTIKDADRLRMMNAFFFWATWATVTNRPGEDISYTHNWPPEALVGNVATGSMVFWSVISFVLLLAGIGALAWFYAMQRPDPRHPAHPECPTTDPLLAVKPTPSMRATLKYFWVAGALWVIQVLLGVVTAHYGVEGGGLYGIPLDKWLPYSVARTWHLQLGILWIATTWLATGLFIAPAVSGHEPKFQRLGVNVLFVALVIIVVGSLFGQWLAVQQVLTFEQNFWFGHMGYEYVDMGRFWQLFLWAGLFIWLGLMVRAMWPAFKDPNENRNLLGLFLLASAAIALFWGAGVMWNRETNLAIAEYWRWWVVHLWVEGFFEVFATTVIAFLFTRMGLIRSSTAAKAVLFSTVIFLFGGILGTFHHLYFSGTTLPVLAIGATFSALEVVPLVLIGFEAYEHYSHTHASPWVTAYKWPIYFFIAVAFWNLVGAGLFGFFINPPIALYYMQGLNTTPVHGHTALFGVYGMLGLGLMLFCLKGLATHQQWKTKMLAFAFWSINLGLALMVLLSLLPIGLLQTWASVDQGYWYARSAEFTQTGLMDTLRWLRVVGDTLFAIGALALGWFVYGLKFGWSVSNRQEPYTKPPTDQSP